MKPVMFIDNDFINNVFGRGKSFDEDYGLDVLDTLTQRYDIQITDRVFEEATHDPSWPKDRAVLGWLRENGIRPIPTNVEPGRDLGERSIVDASETTSLPFDERIVMIASDDRKFFQPGGGGADYVDMRITAQDAKKEAVTIRNSKSVRADIDKPWRQSLQDTFGDARDSSGGGASEERRSGGRGPAQDGQSAVIPS